MDLKVYWKGIVVCRLWMAVSLMVNTHLTEGRTITVSEERIVLCQPENIIEPYAEDPESYHEGSCPTHPGPEDVLEEACSQCECWSDSNCDVDRKCCYNGCKNTCIEYVILEPPPIIDWVAEPPRQRLAGNAWLIPGPENPYGEETCSTSVFEDGGDPLKCPRGYLCYIRDIGDEENGIPNSGICIRE